jgi:non-specific serine/threonine protein kinase
MNQDGWSHIINLYTKEHQLKKNYAFFDQKGGNSLEISPDYFEKFIKDIAKKSRHKRHGFWSYFPNCCSFCNLQLVHDFFKTPISSVFFWL